MWQGHEAYLEFKDTTQADLSNGGAHGPEAWFSVQTVLASNQAAPPVIRKRNLPMLRKCLASSLVGLGSEIPIPFRVH